MKNDWSQDGKILYTDANDTKMQYKRILLLNHTLTTKFVELMTGNNFENLHFLFLNVLVSQEAFYIVTNLKLLVVENTHLSHLVYYNFLLFYVGVF